VTSEPLLVVDGLTHKLGALAVLSGVSFRVEERERRAIIGPNGAGKTTLFNVLTGHLTPQQGRIRFAGASINGLRPHEVAQRGVSRSFQRNNLFLSLSVGENLRLGVAARERANYNPFASPSHMRASLEKAREVAEVVTLAERFGDVVGSLSYGEQRQLELGVALATSPRLLLLDEPTAGMSPEETQRMTHMLQGLPPEITIMIIEHDMDVVLSIAQRVTVLHQGSVLLEGTFEEVSTDPRVHEVYLGGSFEDVAS
jgi:branched-chain amino acid transport system ATP-binding protein